MTYDILVLGSGPAGFYTALTCAKGGLKTAVVEKSEMGGTGFSTGCLPVKAILDKIRRIKIVKKELQERNIPFQLEKLINNTLHDMKGHSPSIAIFEQNRLEEAGIDFYCSKGEFLDKNTYLTRFGEIKADKIIIATGTEAASIEDSDFSRRILSHKSAVILNEVPTDLIIIGGDVEGIEFASIFSQLGSRVTVIELFPSILPGYDRDLVKPVLKELKDKNVQIICSTKVLHLKESEEKVLIKTEESQIFADKVLVTGFRKASFPDGYKRIGLEIDQNAIPTDKNYETNIPGIYAVGDINGILCMAGTAIQQAVHLSDYLLKGIAAEQDYSILPRAVFTIPQICGGGIQEKDILSDNSGFSVNTFPLENNWRAFVTGEESGFVKLISDKNDIVRGIWFSGDFADSYGSAIGFLLKQKMTLDELRRELYIHPTIFESVFEAGLL